MGHVNPHYDPEWKKVHDHHAAERALGKGKGLSDRCGQDEL